MEPKCSNDFNYSHVNPFIKLIYKIDDALARSKCLILITNATYKLQVGASMINANTMGCI